MFVAFTVAPATTAPDGSVTVPLIAPRKVCPYALTASRVIARTRPNQRRIVISIAPQVGSQRFAEKLAPKPNYRCGHDEALFPPKPGNVQVYVFQHLARQSLGGGYENTDFPVLKI